MKTISEGRWAAAPAAPFVVFIIGMRVNRFRAIRRWLPVAAAMGPMLAQLSKHPEKGYLGGETLLSWRGVTQIQYWRSFDDLETFARNPDDPHLRAWTNFQRSAARTSAVGIWHETYRIAPGGAEAIYTNMPPIGLGAVSGAVPAAGEYATARRRMQAGTAQGVNVEGDAQVL